jgi:hypothetical protein
MDEVLVAPSTHLCALDRLWEPGGGARIPGRPTRGPIHPARGHRTGAPHADPGERRRRRGALSGRQPGAGPGLRRRGRALGRDHRRRGALGPGDGHPRPVHDGGRAGGELRLRRRPGARREPLVRHPGRGQPPGGRGVDHLHGGRRAGRRRGPGHRRHRRGRGLGGDAGGREPLRRDDVDDAPGRRPGLADRRRTGRRRLVRRRRGGPPPLHAARRDVGHLHPPGGPLRPQRQDRGHRPGGRGLGLPGLRSGLPLRRADLAARLRGRRAVGVRRGLRGRRHTLDRHLRRGRSGPWSTARPSTGSPT